MVHRVQLARRVGPVGVGVQPVHPQGEQVDLALQGKVIPEAQAHQLQLLVEQAVVVAVPVALAGQVVQVLAVVVQGCNG